MDTEWGGSKMNICSYRNWTNISGFTQSMANEHLSNLLLIAPPYG